MKKKATVTNKALNLRERAEEMFNFETIPINDRRRNKDFSLEDRDPTTHKVVVFH